MNTTDYKLTVRGKDGHVVAATCHPDNDAAHQALKRLAAEMHLRPEAKNTGVFDAGARGWLWDTSVKEVCIAGTYAIEPPQLSRHGYGGPFEGASPYGKA